MKASLAFLALPAVTLAFQAQCGGRMNPCPEAENAGYQKHLSNTYWRMPTMEEIRSAANTASAAATSAYNAAYNYFWPAQGNAAAPQSGPKCLEDAGEEHIDV